MKYILPLFILFFFCTTTLSAQTDFNGRDAKARNAQKTVTNTPIQTSTSDPAVAEGYDKDEGFYEPSDLLKRQLESHFLNSEDAELFLEKLNELEAKVQALQEENQSLSVDNETIKRSLNNCFEETLNEENKIAFLLQAAPNPFTENTNIQFFVPADASKAVIQIRDVEGTILKTYSITEKGMNTISVAGEQLMMGSYIYTLAIDGEIVDSKVMILAKK